jgi:multiple sugar transport system ATP-binding protein
MLGIDDLLKRKPGQLPAWLQRQRVRWAARIVREPDAFLMDEPLSNLDAKLRVEMRAYLAPSTSG